MTFSNEGDRNRQRKAEHASGENAEASTPVRRRRGQSGEYGSTLRSVYQATVQEDIPSEFLDLLGKLD